MSRVSPVSAVTLTALVATGFAAPAWAQQEQSVTVAGRAAQMCILDTPEQGDGVLENFDNPAGATFSITELADPVTLSTRAARITVSLDAMCTSLHRVELASDGDGLWRIGGAATPTGFADAVPYRANLVWANAQNDLQAQADVRQARRMEVLVGQPYMGEMLIEFEIQAGATNAGAGAPLVAGDYSDILRVTMEAQ